MFGNIPSETQQNEPLETFSEVNSEIGESSPVLLTVAPSSRTNLHTSTNESVTSFEDEGFNSSVQNPWPSGTSVIIDTQLTNPQAFKKASRNVQILPENQTVELQGNSREKLMKKRKQQVCVKYKKNGSSLLLSQDYDEISRMSLTSKFSNAYDYQKSLTYHDPIAIIHNLNCEDNELLEEEISHEVFNSTGSLIKKLRVPVLNKLGEQDCPVFSLASDISSIRKYSSGEGRHFPEEAEIKIKELKLNYEAKFNELERQKSEAQSQMQKASVKAQLLEEENNSLGHQIEELLAVPKSTKQTSIGSSLIMENNSEFGCQVELACIDEKLRQEFSHLSVENLKQSELLKKFEKERTGLKSKIDKQQVLLHKLQEEQAERDKQNLLLLREVQNLNNLNSGLMDIKRKFEQLQDESRKKDLDAARRNEKTTKKEETSKLEELTYRLGQEIEWKTKQLSEYQVQLDTITKRNEEYKQEIRKRSHRTRDLKKERDRLKIELLQLKQSLRNKVKQKDEIIQKLEEELNFFKKRNGAVAEPFHIRNVKPLQSEIVQENCQVESYVYSKDNLSSNNQFFNQDSKDVLLSTHKMDDSLYGKGDRNMELLGTPDEVVRMPSTEKGYKDGISEKSKSSLSDYSNLGMDPRHYFEQPESHQISHTSNSRGESASEVLEEKIGYIKGLRKDAVQTPTKDSDYTFSQNYEKILPKHSRPKPKDNSSLLSHGEYPNHSVTRQSSQSGVSDSLLSPFVTDNKASLFSQHSSQDSQKENTTTSNCRGKSHKNLLPSAKARDYTPPTIREYMEKLHGKIPAAKASPTADCSVKLTPKDPHEAHLAIKSKRHASKDSHCEAPPSKFMVEAFYPALKDSRSVSAVRHIITSQDSSNNSKPSIKDKYSNIPGIKIAPKNIHLKNRAKFSAFPDHSNNIPIKSIKNKHFKRQFI